jgi:hypothetical protein
MARSAFRAMGLWIGLEFLIRFVGTLLLVFLFVPWNVLMAQPLERAVPYTVLTLVVAMLVLGGVFLRKVARDGLSWREMGYDWSLRTIAAGAVGAIALVWATDYAAGLQHAFGPDATNLRIARAYAHAGPLAHAGLLLGNAVLGPIVEELAWRGYVQTRLARAWPMGAALVVTAVAFAVKHVIVDMSLSRGLMLLTGSLLLGIVRAWYGTAASTIGHLIMNLEATLLLILIGPPVL